MPRVKDSDAPGVRPLECSISPPSGSCIKMNLDFSMMIIKIAWLLLRHVAVTSQRRSSANAKGQACTWGKTSELFHLIPICFLHGGDGGLLNDDDEDCMTATGEFVHLGGACRPLHCSSLQQAIDL